QAVRHFGFGHPWPVLGSCLGDEMHLVGVAAHDAGGGADVVGDDPVAAFAVALGGGVLDDALGLGGEADHQAGAAWPGLGEGGEDVRVGDEGERRAGVASVLLDLLVRGFGDAPIGDGGGADGDV